MTRYRYTVIEYNGPVDLANTLNTMAERGWELVGFPSEHVGVMKILENVFLERERVGREELARQQDSRSARAKRDDAD